MTSLLVAHGEQFIHSAKGLNGAQITSSPGLIDLLPQTILSQLLTAPDPEKMKDPCQRLVCFQTEGVVAATRFTVVLDGWKRRTIHNHTILLREDDYYALGAHPSLFQPAFTSESPKTLSSIDLSVCPLDLGADLEYLWQRLGKQLPDVLRTLAASSLDQSMTADIGLRAPADERLKLLYACLTILPSSLRAVSWTTEGCMTTVPPWHYSLAVRENWRLTISATPTSGFQDLPGALESLPSLRLFHERYNRLFSELRSYEWGLYNQVVNQIVGASRGPLRELDRLRPDRRELVRRRIFEDLKSKLL